MLKTLVILSVIIILIYLTISLYRRCTEMYIAERNTILDKCIEDGRFFKLIVRDSSGYRKRVIVGEQTYKNAQIGRVYVVRKR